MMELEFHQQSIFVRWSLMDSYISATSQDARVIELDAYRHGSNFSSYSDAEPNETKWAAWQTLLFILVTCGSFWLSVGWSLKAIFG